MTNTSINVDKKSRLVVGVEAPVSGTQRLRIAQAEGVARVISAAELAETPALFAELDVLFARATPSAGIKHATKLRWIQTFGAGVDGLLSAELPAGAELVITNASGIHAQPIAEHVFAFILAFARRLDRSLAAQADRSWLAQSEVGALRSLAGATLGVLGPGAIGKRVAEIGRAFGMRVIGYRRRAGELPGFDEVHRGDALPAFLAASDYLVNILPGTPETRHFLGRGGFAAMRRGAFLVNVGRGSTVDADALLEALASGRLGGAGLDVTEPEPLPREHRLWQHENVLITPHYAGAHPGYDVNATELFLDNLARFRAGTPLRNLVDVAAGY